MAPGQPIDAQRPMDKKKSPRERPSFCDRHEAVETDSPAPDAALARDDLPKDERIAQQNDLA